MHQGKLHLVGEIYAMEITCIDISARSRRDTSYRRTRVDVKRTPKCGGLLRILPFQCGACCGEAYGTEF